MKLFFLLIAVAIVCSSLKCKKDAPSPSVLPSVTQNGNNTIGFTINGSIWVPYFPCRFGADPCGRISARYGEPMADLSAFDLQVTRRKTESTSTLTITSSTIGTISSVGDKTDSIYVDYQEDGWPGNGSIYGGPLPGSHFVITKLDLTQRIISGTFDLVLREQNGTGKLLQLKDGRFDFRLNACLCD